MPDIVNCTSCGKEIEVEKHTIGAKYWCTKCGKAGKAVVAIDLSMPDIEQNKKCDCIMVTLDDVEQASADDLSTWNHGRIQQLEAELKAEHDRRVELEIQNDVLSTTVNQYVSPYYEKCEELKSANSTIRAQKEEIARLRETLLWAKGEMDDFFKDEMYVVIEKIMEVLDGSGSGE